MFGLTLLLSSRFQATIQFDPANVTAYVGQSTLRCTLQNIGVAVGYVVKFAEFLWKCGRAELHLLREFSAE